MDSITTLYWLAAAAIGGALTMIASARIAEAVRVIAARSRIARRGPANPKSY